MNIERITSFCTVVKTGSMSGAAQKLYCSQSAVSKHVMALEDELGCKLFFRQGKKLVLSESGKAVYAFGERYLEDCRQLRATLYRLRLAENQSLAFGATNFIGTYWVPAALARYKEGAPDRQIMFTIDFWPALSQLLSQGQISLALAPETDELLASQTIDRYPVAEDEMRLALPARHPLLDADAVTADMLLRYPLLLPQEQSATRRFVTEKLAQSGLKLQHVMDLGTAQAVKQGIISGMGIGILSVRSVAAEERAGLLRSRPIEGLNLRRWVYAVKVRKRVLNREEKALIHIMQELYAPKP